MRNGYLLMRLCKSQSKSLYRRSTVGPRCLNVRSPLVSSFHARTMLKNKTYLSRHKPNIVFAPQITRQLFPHVHFDLCLTTQLPSLFSVAQTPDAAQQVCSKRVDRIFFFR